MTAKKEPLSEERAALERDRAVLREEQQQLDEAREAFERLKARTSPLGKFKAECHNAIRDLMDMVDNEPPVAVVILVQHPDGKVYATTTSRDGVDWVRLHGISSGLFPVYLNNQVQTVMNASMDPRLLRKGW